jgi:hypothetical protein
VAEAPGVANCPLEHASHCQALVVPLQLPLRKLPSGQVLLLQEVHAPRSVGVLPFKYWLAPQAGWSLHA